MENFINSLPKPVLALGILTLFTTFVLLLNPPHTVCDTQKESLIQKQAGSLFANKKEKKSLPPVIGPTKLICQHGNSAGACYEYFNVLKKLANDILLANSECLPELYNLSEVKQAMNDGLEMMVRMAWGSRPPESPVEKNGWLQESELVTFCRIQRVTNAAIGAESYSQLKKKIIKKLPGNPPAMQGLASLNQSNQAPPSAISQMSEEEILKKSLWSARCDYL